MLEVETDWRKILQLGFLSVESGKIVTCRAFSAAEFPLAVTRRLGRSRAIGHYQRPFQSYYPSIQSTPTPSLMRLVD
ncbi:hypothetical protein T4A_12073 [Trichinella pseudospiralis]|uniref:Uncharacterized protein n=1 Tax=Trichinella pseudospiralis TaxID=6337 RepID=A0A0V1G2C6_TRIPS|nr:hypothetical protein T4A_12073 [Trichinella pseudospiralis]KRY92398.1 hypothetical protein T4D_15536 [Trichinella pseudospiralis]KRZ46223.1 hypothetical protein T4C_2436 [Trichinella pseudospiralis]